jgi:hypothetical protein
MLGQDNDGVASEQLRIESKSAKKINAGGIKTGITGGGVAQHHPAQRVKNVSKQWHVVIQYSGIALECTNDHWRTGIIGEDAIMKTPFFVPSQPLIMPALMLLVSLFSLPGMLSAAFKVFPRYCKKSVPPLTKTNSPTKTAPFSRVKGIIGSETRIVIARHVFIKAVLTTNCHIFVCFLPK